MTTPPLNSAAEAMDLPAVRAIHQACQDGRSTLAAGNAAALRKALAPISLGSYDEHIVAYLSDWEPHVIAGVLCTWMERLAGQARAGRDEAVQLLADALFLRVNGERPPGAPADDPEAETWQEWDRRAEVFLRSLLPPE